MPSDIAVFVRLAPDMAVMARALADADGRTLAAWVRVAIAEKIEREVVRA